MRFYETDIDGAFLIEREPYEDERGYFARLYCENEFHKADLDISFVQMNLCENKKAGTLRGLHYQTGNKVEDKMVSCLHGRIFDVCVDIRRNSRSFGKWIGYELSEKNNKMLFLPKGCAHGYITLEAKCQLLYLMSEYYAPGYDAGYRYDDPIFNIKWPILDVNEIILSDKDKNWPYFQS